jgi:hypothetical protein
MPRTDPNQVTRYLTQEEAELRRQYVAAHPGEPEPMPTTAGWAPIADWLDSLVPAEVAATEVAAPTPADPDWQYAG